jgi:putative FmdB family regulatory protein
MTHRAIERRASENSEPCSLKPMPIYEYRCPKGHVFEVLQRMDAAQPVSCEVCGASPVERVLHPVAIHSGGESRKGESSKESGKTSGDS